MKYIYKSKQGYYLAFFNNNYSIPTIYVTSYKKSALITNKIERLDKDDFWISIPVLNKLEIE